MFFAFDSDSCFVFDYSFFESDFAFGFDFNSVRAGQWASGHICPLTRANIFDFDSCLPVVLLSRN